MPGIVVFRRRWSFGSDDLVVPSVFLLTIHLTWTIILGVITGIYDFDLHKECSVGLVNLKHYLIGYLSMLGGNILVEGLILFVSLRGTILDPSPRICMQYLIYLGIAILVAEIAWQILGVIWMGQHYHTCGPVVPMKAALGLIVCNWVIMLTVIVSGWCTYDMAGKKWVKMKRYQESLKEKSHRNKRNSGRRNWRQRSSVVRLYSAYESVRRKAIRAYEESWDKRFQILCCCVERDAPNKNSITEVAKLFTEFFRDLDVVPSDVIAGFVLLRHQQKLQMHHVVTEGSNDVYQYLSGRAITPQTEFLQLGQPEVMEEYKLVVHYMRFALAAYGWPAFMMMNTGTGLCKMIPSLRCCCCHACGCSLPKDPDLIDDNCCHCNFVALLKLSGLNETDIAYVTYHVDIGETPFYVGLDHRHKKVVICVRGTLSLQDVLTDLKADAETLPLDPVREEWVGHKGMVQAAVYIQKKLKEDQILAKAFRMDLDRGTQKYDLVLVGHSLGAGTASILAILLRQEYPTLHCYAFSPPGGLLSDVCVDETKSFITSVVVGKDVVPRIGLSQLEVLRTDLINVIKNSTQPKWKIIARGICCGSEENMLVDEIQMATVRDNTAHPLDSQIGLSTHLPLYPPGKIIHVVRSHPRGKKKHLCGSGEPVFQAVWAHKTSFDEVLVSPTMINDHMPDNVMDALEKVLVNVAPPKPNRTLTEAERKAFLQKRSPSIESENPNGKLIVQEDFTMGKAVPTCNQLPLYKPQHQSLPPLFSWDHAADEHKFLLRKDFLNPGDPGKQDLFLDLETDPIMAPLASPETLSEVSSVGSALSRISSLNKDNKRRSIIIPQVLETIQQSPVSKNKVGDFPPPTEPIHLNGRVNDKTPQIGNCVQIKTNVVIESPPRIRQELEKNAESVVNDSLVPLLCDCNTDRDECDIVGNGEFKNMEYSRHSPVDGNQYEYGNPNVYYSPAGIGYPHGSGAYHPPTCHMNMDCVCPECIKHSMSSMHSPEEVDKIIKCSQSESQLLHLSARYVMKRSTEQRDIAHLQDSAEVFHGEITSPMSHQTVQTRFRLLPKGSNPITSDGTQASTNSLEDDSDRRLSSSHSDDVFDLPLEETDV